MPELPEVERARKLVHEETVGRTIVDVEVQEDDIVYVNPKASEFLQRIQGKTVVDTGRRGKHFYMLLEDGPTILLHLGMTGNIRFEGKSCFQYRKGTEEQTVWPPKYWKFILSFNDKDSKMKESKNQPLTRMAFTDPRRLARIRLVEDVLNEPPVSKLGFDPILSMPSFEDFYAKVQKRTAPIKALLLDQEFSAGIGNYMADEILYQGRIHPAQPAKTLTTDEARSVYQQILDVTNFAVSVNADYQKFPVTWLFHYRWNKGKKNKVTTHDGNEIVYQTVGGRTTAIVPAVQILRNTNKTGEVKPSSKSKKKANVKEELEEVKKEELEEKLIKRSSETPTQDLEDNELFPKRETRASRKKRLSLEAIKQES